MHGLTRIVFIIGTISIFQNCYGDVAIQWLFGSLRSNTGIPVEEGSLWALIAVNPESNLPGGLNQDESLTNDHVQKAKMAFSGKTIAPGETIGQGIVISTGQIGQKGFIETPETLTNQDFQNLEPGGLIGLYWFPGIIASSAILPQDGFDIGGFQQTIIDTEFGGNAGMIIPNNNGQSIGITYLDSEITSLPSSLPPERFTAIYIPPRGYDVWRDLNFTQIQIAAGDGDPGADPDGDGLANLLEYATGGNPLLGGPSPLVLNRLGESVVLEFHQVADPELRYRIEATDDLGISPWPDVVFESSGVANVDGLIEITRPIQPGRRFFRLRVEFVDGSEF